MQRLLLPVICLAALALAACTGDGRPAAGTDSTDGIAGIKERGTIRIGVKENAPPFSSRVGETYVGFDIDIAHAVAAELGLGQPTFVPVTSGNRIGKLLRDEVDLVIASTTITRSREQLVDFSLPYFEDGQMLLVEKDSQIRSYLDLAGKKVAALEGSTSAGNMAQVAPSATVVGFEDTEAAIQALIRGEVDAYTSDGLMLVGLAKKYAEAGLQVVGSRFSSEPYGVAMREDQSDLRDAVNFALQRLWETNIWHDTYQTWFGPGSTYQTQIDFAMAPYPE